MRKLILAALALAAISATSSLPAHAGDQDFTLVNRTGYQIDGIFVSPNSEPKWGPDIMGRDALADGEQVAITFVREADACKWDLKARYNDGEQATWAGVDLCTTSKISLFYDHDAGTTRAVTE